MLKKCLCITIILFILVCGVACSRRDATKSEPSNLPAESELISEPIQSSTSDSASDSSISEESSINESLSESPGGDWPTDWPEKYRTNHKYVVAQPKNETIKTYLYDAAKQNYSVIDSPIPDYMITLHDYLIPILEKYDGVQIDIIVYDNSNKKVCVNFNPDYTALYASDETKNNEILYSIAKTIMENDSFEIDGVYFEIDMKPFMEPDIS